MLLIPRLEGQLFTYEQWSENTPFTPFELWDGMLFTNQNMIDGDRLLIGLLYISGLEHFLDLLPEESIELLGEQLEQKPRK